MRNGSNWEREKLEHRWSGYRDTIKRLTDQVRDAAYDGVAAYGGVAAYPSAPPRWGIDALDRYLLPCQSRWLNVEELFEPPPVPDFPAIPEPPKLQLKEGAYSSSYLEAGRNGSPSSLERDIAERTSILTRRDELLELIAEKKRNFLSTLDAEAYRLTALRMRVCNDDPKAIEEVITLANRRHPVPYRVQLDFRVLAVPGAQVILIELKFPDFARHEFQIGRSATGKIRYAPAAQKKKIVRQCLYSLVVRAGYVASTVLGLTSYKTIAINVSQDWFDPATGAARTGIICSLQAEISEFAALHLDKVDPEACFRHLKGIAVPSFDSISPIRPIFILDKNDDRFIASRDLESLLSPETNLAAMPWEDFEQLVAQLFQWEFVKEGVEVRVTRVSRDRGVDAVLFDPDPLRGGKFVLQAKRYTKPVDVAAVRDLYGTVVNEGANRGILITTSSYGPDSYAFAKDKPISLVDGPNLLVMLRRHGKKFRIDLEEARRLNQASPVDF